MNGAIARGLSLEAFNQMEVGAIADYVISYNNMHDREDKHQEDGKHSKKQAVRQANQNDWDRFSV